jgi:hypothetical protein
VKRGRGLERVAAQTERLEQCVWKLTYQMDRWKEQRSTLETSSRFEKDDQKERSQGTMDEVTKEADVTVCDEAQEPGLTLRLALTEAMGLDAGTSETEQRQEIKEEDDETSDDQWEEHDFKIRLLEEDLEQMMEKMESADRLVRKKIAEVEEEFCEELQSMIPRIREMISGQREDLFEEMKLTADALISPVIEEMKLMDERRFEYMIQELGQIKTKEGDQAFIAIDYGELQGWEERMEKQIETIKSGLNQDRLETRSLISTVGQVTSKMVKIESTQDEIRTRLKGIQQQRMEGSSTGQAVMTKQ